MIRVQEVLEHSRELGGGGQGESNRFRRGQIRGCVIDGGLGAKDGSMG